MLKTHRRMLAWMLLACLLASLAGCGGSGVRVGRGGSGTRGSDGGLDRAAWAAAAANLVGSLFMVSQGYASSREDGKPGLGAALGVVGAVLPFVAQLLGGPEPDPYAEIAKQLEEIDGKLDDLDQDIQVLREAVTAQLARLGDRIEADIRMTAVEGHVDPILNRYDEFEQIRRPLSEGGPRIPHVTGAGGRSADERLAMWADAILAGDPGYNIPDTLANIHRRVVGAPGVKSVLKVYAAYLVEEARSGGSGSARNRNPEGLKRAYLDLEQYFSQLLSVQAQGCRLVLEALELHYMSQDLNPIPVADGASLAAFDSVDFGEQFRDDIETQVDLFLTCVEQLVLSQCELYPDSRIYQGSDSGKRVKTFLPMESVTWPSGVWPNGRGQRPCASEIFYRADLLAADTCHAVELPGRPPKHTHGLNVRYIGEPSSVQKGQPRYLWPYERRAVDVVPAPTKYRFYHTAAKPGDGGLGFQGDLREPWFRDWVKQQWSDRLLPTLDYFRKENRLCAVKFHADVPRKQSGTLVAAIWNTKYELPDSFVLPVDWHTSPQLATPYANLTFGVRYGPREVARGLQDPNNDLHFANNGARWVEGRTETHKAKNVEGDWVQINWLNPGFRGECQDESRKYSIDSPHYPAAAVEGILKAVGKEDAAEVSRRLIVWSGIRTIIDDPERIYSRGAEYNVRIVGRVYWQAYCHRSGAGRAVTCVKYQSKAGLQKPDSAGVLRWVSPLFHDETLKYNEPPYLTVGVKVPTDPPVAETFDEVVPVLCESLGRFDIHLVAEVVVTLCYDYNKNINEHRVMAWVVIDEIAIPWPGVDL